MTSRRMGRRITLPGVEVEKGAGLEPVTRKTVAECASDVATRMPLRADPKAGWSAIRAGGVER